VKKSSSICTVTVDFCRDYFCRGLKFNSVLHCGIIFNARSGLLFSVETQAKKWRHEIVIEVFTNLLDSTLPARSSATFPFSSQGKHTPVNMLDCSDF
jgi:hypothetical protein